DPQELRDAFKRYILGETYHSITVTDIIKKILSKESYLDTFNRQIILCLSQGIKTKHLPVHLNMSLSAIEKRKAQIKDYLCIDKFFTKQTSLATLDRQVILCLSQGIKTRHLPVHLNMALSALEKLKAQLKDDLSINKRNDDDIVAAARRLG